MNDLTVEIEFCNSRQLLESATRLVAGALEGLADSHCRQYEVLCVAYQYLIELDRVLSNSAKQVAQ